MHTCYAYWEKHALRIWGRDVARIGAMTVVVIEIRVLSPRRRTPSLGVAETACVQQNARQRPTPCKRQYIHIHA